MNTKDILKNMLELQQKLNDETNGIGWENGYTKEGKLISFRRCIYMECAELIDSFAWKHWKSINNPTNWDNVRIEIVDIWHFIMSLILEEYKEKNITDKNFIAEEVSSVSFFDDFCKENPIPKDADTYGILNDIELIIHKCSGFDYDLGELLSVYFVLAKKCGLNFFDLYKIYIGKNILNQFRQENGYKDGIYKKNWNGIEDNEVLNQILKDTLKYEEIYARLQKAYKQAQ
ncbi:dUTPase, dimeric [Campylobacter insulaenigrae]|uniref:dUTPase, dimeric n=2 Tax=Campylobacter insulaenigrae TaxID=260714 RepID=A0A0A8H3C3_9BACT|nr:dUTPase, dimeric [Campylobacter insulaenigrae]AJC87394.1 dUTPase, dimeric [Campylobacter insulaenigrae NCTC 12927]MCR6570505.1 dUTPase, dimeric [Campylobacter insulaenigrae]MCR6572078.1 dUTPase, dimeric [Campylobacter insulaenigrae]MCR6573786.1 dUTPase, dimeric [Campylobacter insulaenigrae]MCR6575548.1 dUTPase, dimeric [Campylobacter insulaenigrae]